MSSTPDFTSHHSDEDGGLWGMSYDDDYASGHFGADEPPVRVPEAELAGYNKAIVSSALGLLGLGLAAGTIATVKYAKRRKRGGS